MGRIVEVAVNLTGKSLFQMFVIVMANMQICCLIRKYPQVQFKWNSNVELFLGQNTFVCIFI